MVRHYRTGFLEDPKKQTTYASFRPYPFPTDTLVPARASIPPAWPFSLSSWTQQEPPRHLPALLSSPQIAFVSPPFCAPSRLGHAVRHYYCVRQDLAGLTHALFRSSSSSQHPCPHHLVHLHVDPLDHSWKLPGLRQPCLQRLREVVQIPGLSSHRLDNDSESVEIPPLPPNLTRVMGRRIQSHCGTPSSCDIVSRPSALEERFSKYFEDCKRLPSVRCPIRVIENYKPNRR